MNKKELEMLYETNDEFKAYVDKYCWNKNLTLNQALMHKVVQAAADYYKTKV